MLQPIQTEIAKIVGYSPLTNDEGVEQYPAEVNFISDGTSVPYNGAVKKDKNGVLRMYWMPRLFKNQFDELVGWYDIPTMEEIEEWTFDSICFTPGDDEVEPDHPDSWLCLLGLI